MYHQLKFAFMGCLWVPRMICMLVLDIVTEVTATMYEIMLLLLELIAHLVAHLRFLILKQSISETPRRVRQLMMEHRGLWGMDDYKRKVHKFLESQLRRDSILGFWGISGVGKTRLLFLIGDCYGDVDSPFRYIIALKHGDVRDMQQNIASFLNLDWNAMSSPQENCRANIISEKLKNASFLLMLDDVEDGDLNLASIGLPMPLRYGQKVILTSKSQAVCGRMGCTKANIVEMKCLGEEDAWNLFKYKAGVQITEDDVEIHKMAKLMVLACGGLPKAICSIGIGIAGATCSGMNPDDWWFAYERFKANKLRGYSGLVGVDINLQESAGPSEAQVSDLQTVSSSSQSSAGPSKRGKTAVPRTTPGPHRGLRSDKEGYVELAVPNAPSRRKLSIAHLVGRLRLLVLTSEKQSISKTPHRARQLMMQYPDLWGMEDYKCKVHKFLESESRHDSILGFWGTSGVGKTRLILLIAYCYGDVNSPFSHIIVFKHGDVRDMQHNLAASLNLDWNSILSSQEHCRANIISEHLKKTSFLLLLDDLEDGDLDLASIGLPMPLCYGQKVILTSKSQSVCGRIGCTKANTVEMKCLGEEDAWNLFKYNAGVEITEADAEIHKIAKQMVSTCGGLPRAICSIGIGIAWATCSGMNPDDWFFAYERFKANKLPGCSDLVGVDINLQESAGPSEAQVSDLQTVSSSSQSSAGPSKRGKTAVPRTTPAPRRGLRSDKEGYVELVLPNAPSRRKVSRAEGAADSGDAEDWPS